MTTNTIAVVGENLVDLLVNATGEVTAVIGGGPLNVSRTIARLGGETTLVSGISSDAFGQQIRQSLSADGVTLLKSRDATAPTTLAVVALNNGQPSYHFHLTGTAAFDVSVDELDDVPTPAALYFGTLGLVVEPMASVGEEFVLRAPADTLVLLDPNCRPSAITDDRSYRDRVIRLAARSDVIKVSTEDLSYLSPDVDVMLGAQSLLDAGGRVVIVTDGGDPVRVISPYYTLSIDVPATDIVDAVGAGDALIGGFLQWWIGQGHQRDDLRDPDLVTQAIEAAIEVSRRNCQRAGAEPPYASELTALASWAWLGDI